MSVTWFKLTALMLTAAIVTAVTITLCSRRASADSPTGLFAEQKTEVVGVRVARVVDTKNGNVCYVATRSDSTTSAAISCVPARVWP